MRGIFIFVFLISNLFSQNCEKIIAFDYMEDWNWAGYWWTNAQLGKGGASTWATNVSVSPTLSAVIYGAGNGNSVLEQDWYVLPNITGLNPEKQYVFKFKLASHSFTAPTANTRGVDAGDYVDVQVSTNGGVSYITELRITGNSNAQYSYSAIGSVSHTANRAFLLAEDVYQNPSGGGVGGLSNISLTLPSGISQVAIDIYFRVNSAGEEWWIDDVELVELSPIEINTTLEDGDFVWNGAINEDMTNVNNWWVFNSGVYNTPSNLPSTNINVIIPKNQECVNNPPNLQSNTISVKNITVEQDAEFILSSGVLNINGDWRNFGEVDFGSSSLVFIGGADNDTLFNPSAFNEFYNLVVNKSNGELVLEDHIKVKNELSIAQGNFRLNQKTIDLDRTGFISNEGDGHRAYCDCPSAYIRKVVDIPTNTTINPGNLGLTITTSSKAMGETVIKRRHESAEDLNGVYRIFDVTPQFNGNLNLSLEFQYFTTEVEDLSLQSTFAIYRSTDSGGSWNEEGGFNIIDDKTVIITGWNEFSWVTVAPSQNGSTLPVEYLDFTATLVNNRVELNWETATEINNEKFEIERSENGTDFKKIGEQSGANNSVFVNRYKYTDEYLPSADVIYYRLKQIDFNGDFEYSIIVWTPIKNTETFFEYYTLLGAKVVGEISGSFVKVERNRWGEIVSSKIIFRN